MGPSPAERVQGIERRFKQMADGMKLRLGLKPDADTMGFAPDHAAWQRRMINLKEQVEGFRNTHGACDFQARTRSGEIPDNTVNDGSALGELDFCRLQ
jgi:hypothetical protein